MNAKVVDRFLDSARRWKEEMKLMRKICLSCGLTEDFKWMHPCYMHQERNIVLIYGFKEYSALLFHKGVLLKDTNHILIQQTKNVQSARQIRFSNLQVIVDLEPTIKAYILEAIEVEKSGMEVKMRETSEFEMVEEFKRAVDGNADLKAAFDALTPGRKRGYLLYFSQAKQVKTIEARIEKCVPKILAGKGLND